MANGPRRVGLQQNPALETLERVLGIGQGIAQTVQANRQRRDNFNIRYLNSLTQGYDSITSNTDLQNKLNLLDKFKNNRAENMSAESMDFFNIAEQNLKNQIAENSDYDLKAGLIEKKRTDVKDWVQMMYDYNVSSESDRVKMRANKDENTFRLEQENLFKEMMQTYSSDMKNFYARHNDRLDPFTLKDMVSTQTYMSSILKNWKADNRIDETEYNLYFNGITTGDDAPLKEFEQRRQSLADNLAATDINQFQDLKEQFDALGRASSTGSLSNLLYGQYINQDLIGGDEEGYTKLQPGDEEMLQLSQAEIYKELKKLNSSITGAAYQDLMVRDESFEKVPEAYGFKGSWADYMKTIEKPFVPKNSKFKDDLTTDFEPKDPNTENFINTAKLNYSENIKNLKSNAYNDKYVKPEIKKKTEQLQLFSNYTQDLKWGTWSEVNKDLKKEFKKDKFFNKIDYDKNTGLRNNMMIKGSKNLKNILISQGNRDKDDYSGFTYKELNNLKKEFEEDASIAKSAQENISLMSEDVSAWKRTGQWRSGNWKFTEAGKLYESYIKEIDNFQKKWSGRTKDSPIFDLNEYFSPFITDRGDNFTALSLKRGLEFFEKYIPNFFNEKNKELIEFQAKSEKSGANR